MNRVWQATLRQANNYPLNWFSLWKYISISNGFDWTMILFSTRCIEYTLTPLSFNGSYTQNIYYIFCLIILRLYLFEYFITLFHLNNNWTTYFDKNIKHIIIIQFIFHMKYMEFCLRLHLNSGLNGANSTINIYCRFIEIIIIEESTWFPLFGHKLRTTILLVLNFKRCFPLQYSLAYFLLQNLISKQQQYWNKKLNAFRSKFNLTNLVTLHRFI